MIHAIKHVYSDHPWNPKFVAIFARGLLFSGSFVLHKLKLGLQWSSSCCCQVVVSSGFQNYQNNCLTQYSCMHY